VAAQVVAAPIEAPTKRELTNSFRNKRMATIVVVETAIGVAAFRRAVRTDFYRRSGWMAMTRY
jgi:hypothetical protein